MNTAAIQSAATPNAGAATGRPKVAKSAEAAATQGQTAPLFGFADTLAALLGGSAASTPVLPPSGGSAVAPVVAEGKTSTASTATSALADVFGSGKPSGLTRRYVPLGGGAAAAPVAASASPAQPALSASASPVQPILGVPIATPDLVVGSPVARATIASVHALLTQESQLTDAAAAGSSDVAALVQQARAQFAAGDREGALRLASALILSANQAALGAFTGGAAADPTGLGVLGGNAAHAAPVAQLANLLNTAAHAGEGVTHGLAALVERLTGALGAPVVVQAAANHPAGLDLGFAGGQNQSGMGGGKTGTPAPSVRPVAAPQSPFAIPLGTAAPAGGETAAAADAGLLTGVERAVRTYAAGDVSPAGLPSPSVSVSLPDLGEGARLHVAISGDVVRARIVLPNADMRDRVIGDLSALRADLDARGLSAGTLRVQAPLAGADLQLPSSLTVRLADALGTSVFNAAKSGDSAGSGSNPSRSDGNADGRESPQQRDAGSNPERRGRGPAWERFWDQLLS